MVYVTVSMHCIVLLAANEFRGSCCATRWPSLLAWLPLPRLPLLEEEGCYVNSSFVRVSFSFRALLSEVLITGYCHMANCWGNGAVGRGKAGRAASASVKAIG